MNSGSYGADPKFLSAEDYHSQATAASAMSSAGYMAHGDYYAQHAAMAASQYPGGYPAHMGLNHQQGLAAASYGRDQMSAYGNYYQNATHQQQMLQQHANMVAASGGHLSPLNPGAGSHLTGGARSPVSSPQPQSHNLANNVLNHGGGGGHDGNGNSLMSSGGNGGGSGDGDGYPSPQHSNVASQPQLAPGGGGGGDGMSSDCSDDESSPQSNRQMPVVYPWMKKIHVGGVGKNAMTYFDGSPIAGALIEQFSSKLAHHKQSCTSCHIQDD